MSKHKVPRDFLGWALSACLITMPGYSTAQPAAAPVATAVSTPSAEQSALYRRVLQAANMEAVMRRALDRCSAGLSEGAYTCRYALAHATSEDIFQLFLPAYTRHISADSARRIAVFLESSAGRKSVAQVLEQLDGGPAPAPSLNMDEAKIAALFNATIAGRELYEAMTDSASFNAAYQAFHARFRDEKMASAAASLMRYAEVNAMVSSNQPAQLPIELTGNARVDAAFRLAGQGNQQLTASYARAFAEGRSLLGDIAPVPDLLVSKERLARALRQVDQSEQLTRSLVTMAQADMQANTQAMRDLPGMGAPAAQSYAEGMATSADWLRRLGDNTLRRTAILRQIFTLADTRHGKLMANAGSLQFADPADLKKYQELTAQLPALNAEALSLGRERHAAFRSSIDKLVMSRI